MQYVVYRDAKKEWRWRLVGKNNRRIAVSGEGYQRKGKCLHSIGLIQGGGYDVVDKETGNFLN